MIILGIDPGLATTGFGVLQDGRTVDYGQVSTSPETPVPERIKHIVDQLDRLVRRARQERGPQGDVSQRVLSRLAEREPVMATPMLVFATGYAALASVAIGYGYSLFLTMNDPLLSLFQQSTFVMP